MDVLTPAAVVLCGGHSRRMGRPKADLPFGNSTMLATVAATLATVANPVVVVAAVGQALPPLPPAVEIVRDPVPDQGPLRGLAAGLTALAGRAEVAFAAACDLPLLTPAFVRDVLAELDDADAAVPVADGRPHPLAAAYRVSVVSNADRLLADGRRRLVDLLDAVRVRLVPADAGCLVNINSPGEYAAARLASLPPTVL